MKPRRIVISSPELGLSGATAFMAKLATQLKIAGWEPEWLVTGHATKTNYQWLGEIFWPIHHFPETKLGDIRRRHTLLLDHLKIAPCIYLPTFDFDMLYAVPAMTADVAVALIVHSDEPVYYESAARFERSLNAVIGVSEHITAKLMKALTHSTSRVHKINYGVQGVGTARTGVCAINRPLEVIYCGRLSFYQKRIQDLATIIRQCHAQKLPIRFSIAGTGTDEPAFFKSIDAAFNEGFVRRLGLLSNQETIQALGKADVVIMTSDFEGLPVVLLEAMSQGCIPLVSRIDSGVAELIQDQKNGLLVEVGDIESFVDALIKLARDSAWRGVLSRAAIDRIQSGGFTLEYSAAKYQDLFETLLERDNANLVARTNRTLLPPSYHFTHRLKKRLTSLFQ